LVKETAVKAKMLTFALTTEKRLIVSFWTFFKYLGLEKKTMLEICISV